MDVKRTKDIIHRSDGHPLQAVLRRFGRSFYEIRRGKDHCDTKWPE